MKKAYSPRRKESSLKAARPATSSEAGLIHYELSRRNDVNAFLDATSAIELEISLPRSIFSARSHGKQRVWP